MKLIHDRNKKNLKVIFLFSNKIEFLERVRSLEIIEYDLNTLYFTDS